MEFCKRIGISVRQFEIQCGMSNGYVSSMRKGLGAEKLENVLNAYPKLSREWLLFNDGPMLLEDGTTINQRGHTNKVFGGAGNTVYESETDEIIEIQKKRIEELESQVKKLEAEKAEYWEMIKKLMIK